MGRLSALERRWGRGGVEAAEGLDVGAGRPHGGRVNVEGQRALRVDPAVTELAGEFLEGHPELDAPGARESLAQVIQRAVEDWLEDARAGRQGAERRP